jgi:hypothetical protein
LTNDEIVRELKDRGMLNIPTLTFYEKYNKKIVLNNGSTVEPYGWTRFILKEK